MKTIWKYHVEPSFDIQVPEGGLILSVQCQGEEPYMWICVDPDAPLVTRSFVAKPTGSYFDDTGKHYIATFQVEGSLVFHLFEQE